MTVTTVLRDDVRNARRSRVVVGVVGLFAALTALVFVSEVSVYDDPYRTLFDVSALVAFAFPLIAAPLSYLAIAGDRASGAIKYAIGLPNSRREYVLAKYCSRGTVAAVATLVATALGFGVAAVAFVEAPDPARFAVFGGVSALYAVSVTGVFLGLSALTRSRSRAMFATIGAYFLLVVFGAGLVPVLELGTVLDAVESLLGTTLDESARATVRNLSPANAYLHLTEPVYDGVADSYDRIDGQMTAIPDGLASALWFDALVLVGWGTLVPVAGYLGFARSEP